MDIVIISFFLKIGVILIENVLIIYIVVIFLINIYNALEIVIVVFDNFKYYWSLYFWSI